MSKPGVRQGGRQKGTPNKLTSVVREAFETAFNLLQDDDRANLLVWAKQNPGEFYRLAAKLIPVDMSVQGNVTLQVITGVPTADDEDDEDDVIDVTPDSPAAKLIAKADYTEIC